MVANW